MWTGIVKQLDETSVPCPLSVGPNKAKEHDGKNVMEYMTLYVDHTTVADVNVIREGIMDVEVWYFRCPGCNLIIPAQANRRRFI